MIDEVIAAVARTPVGNFGGIFVNLIEANEAFAVQSVAVNNEMGWDADRVNVNGGSIAIGRPVGASGAHILTTLLYELRRAEAPHHHRPSWVALDTGQGAGGSKTAARFGR